MNSSEYQSAHAETLLACSRERSSRRARRSACPCRSKKSETTIATTAIIVETSDRASSMHEVCCPLPTSHGQSSLATLHRLGQALPRDTLHSTVQVCWIEP